MSRANYLKHLEHDLDASKKIINDLVQEVYELREHLKTVQPILNAQPQRKQEQAYT